MYFEPVLQESLDSIKQISSGKSHGKDIIPPEIYKSRGKNLVKNSTQSVKNSIEGWLRSSRLQGCFTSTHIQEQM